MSSSINSELARALRHRPQPDARSSDEFAAELRENAGLSVILFGFFDGATREFSESWTSCSPECPPETSAKLQRIATLLVSTLASTRSFEAVPNGGERATVFPVCLGAGQFRAWIGKPLAGLFPVMGFQRGAKARSAEQDALLRVGIAYVSQALTRQVYARPIWPDGLVEATLKMLSIEFFVVSADGEVRYDGRSDRTGEEDGWLVRHNRLTLRPENERVALQRTIREAASEPHQASIVSVTVSPGLMRLAAIAPLGPPSEALALVLFESQHTDHFALREHFFHAYGLTRSECGIAHEVLNGKDLAEAAEVTNLSRSTVRSYMKQILAKTGTHRQSELIALYYNSILPVGKSIAKAGSRSVI